MKTTKITADAAYENSHLVARDLLDRVGELLEEMPAPNGERPVHWGHVGDVNHVNALLLQVVQFLSRAPE